ncbi:zinc knuckle CX2CX4HX4C containing protein [Tanacetum coccineum]
MLMITLIGSSVSLAYLTFLEFLKTQSCSEFCPLLSPEPQKDRWIDSPQELSIPGISSKRPLSKGPIPGMTPAQALIAIQTMADHSQKWHDRKTSRNIRSSNSNDRLAALVNKLDKLGRDMKKLKKSVHAIQVGCQICEGPHLDKDCPLNKEVKQVEEVRYGEFGQITPFNRNNGGKFHVGLPGYYTKIDNRPPYGKRRQSLEELLTKHQEEYARRSTKMEVKEKFEQAKVVIVEHEGPNSPKKLKNFHRISFLSDSQEENTIDQLPTKESNPRHFTLPCTIGNFNFYAMADLGASVMVLPRNVFEYLELTNLSETEMLVEMADIRKKAPLRIVRDILVKIDKFLFPSDFVILDQTPNSTIILGRPFLATVHAQINVFEKEISVGIGDERVEDSVWRKRYSKWCNKNSYDKKPWPRNYTFKEWVKFKEGHLDISKSVRKDLFRLWVIDRFTEASDPDKNPLKRCLDKYKWVFHSEIEELADEYEIIIGEKGQILKDIWRKCKRARCKNKDCFICVSGENNETLSLGRKNRSCFRKMIMEEMEEVLGNDGEGSDNEM